MRPSPPPRRLVVVALALSAVAAAGCSLAVEEGAAAEGGTRAPLPTLATLASTTTLPPTTTTPPTTTVAPTPGGVGAPYGSVAGLTMFRGNPSRTWYGAGPIPESLTVRWRYPDEAMCGNSPVGGEDKVWCGGGWTGQPLVWERPDGVTEVIFGAYDKHIHFVDAATGKDTRPPFDMGDIIKGTVTLDPDGYPLLYAGSRDANFRIIALDREEPTELWRLGAESVDGMWNDDWDSNPVVIDDMLYVGGENSWWFAIHLNRGTDADGRVTVDPEVVFSMPAFTDELVGAVGTQQSVESSTAVFEDRAYFANSAGRVVGVDIGRLPRGEASVVFDYWMGDDVDATIVIDEEGYLYVAAQVDLATARAAEVGQLVKLDPRNPDDPRVWGIDVPAGGADGGIWATPALVDGLLFVPTNVGELLAVDTATGDVVWRDDIGIHAWSSAVRAGNRLLVAADCESAAALRIYDISDPDTPVRLSNNTFAGGCIEATPAVWKGRVYVSSRDGFFYALG